MRARVETLAEEDLAAIPTFYRVRMRSRLEARWAVWFDALGIRWQYERAPVWLRGHGRWPDFWLEKEQVWVEIKPAGVAMDEEMALAVHEQTGSPLLWVSGPPLRNAYEVSLLDFGGAEVVEGLRFALGRRDLGDLWLCDVGQEVAFPLPIRNLRAGDDWPLAHCHALRQAYRTAMRWRFEEAERG
jgi:hypothetical protein